MRCATRRSLRSLIPLLSLSSTLCCLGCGNRAIFIQPGTPARVAEPVMTTVWATDDQGKWIKAKTKIPPGAVVGVPKGDAHP